MSGPACSPSSRNSRAAVGVELLVGPGQDGPDVRGRVPGVQRVQRPAGVAQVGGQRGQREAGLAGGAGGGDAQRQGQPRAQLDQLVRGAGSSATRCGAEPAGQQFLRLGVGEHIQGERERALGGDQAGELVAAGHDDQAAGAGRQQRADLVDVPGVIQQHQHPLAGQQAAVQARLRVQAGGDPGRRHGQGVQEEPERPRPGASAARPDRNRAGSRTAARPGTARRPGARSAGPAWSCRSRPSRR